ncbi:MAG: hypothetical protein KDC54_06130, partial [Lewinella sp.]|nr:hypothetical protein [Lewinella sp.]
MNHRYRTILLLLQGMVLFALPLSAQDMADWLGKWEGAIQVPGSQLVLSIQLDQADGAWTGTLDIPSQRVDDMTLAELFIGGDSIAFKLPEVPGNASFSGHLAADTIRGEFRQAGQTLPMAVVREDPGAAAALNAKVDRIRMLVDSFIVGA